MCISDAFWFPDQDGAEPSPNSVAASNLRRLSSFLGKPLKPSSADVYKTFSEMMGEHPVALPEMVSAFIQHNQTPKQASHLVVNLQLV